MATWEFDDGSTLTSGGTVKGGGVAAKELRTFLALPETDRVVAVATTRSEVVLDVKSDYLLNVCVRALSFRLRQHVRTDYRGRDEDAPPYVRRIIDAADGPAARRAFFV